VLLAHRDRGAQAVAEQSADPVEHTAQVGGGECVHGGAIGSVFRAEHSTPFPPGDNRTRSGAAVRRVNNQTLSPSG
jgi:hypothetical protein